MKLEDFFILIFLLIYFFLKLQGENYISMIFFSSFLYFLVVDGERGGSGAERSGRGGEFFLPLFKVVLM